MKIEQAGALSDNDLVVLLDFWVRAWREVFPAIDFAARRDWLTGHLDALHRAGTLVLLTRADADGTPVAFLTLDPKTGAVDQIAVDPDHAGRGVARALVEEAQRLSPSGLNLRVNKANTRACRFYARAGFVVTGEDVSLRSGLPVWLMARHGTHDSST